MVELLLDTYQQDINLKSLSSAWTTKAYLEIKQYNPETKTAPTEPISKFLPYPLVFLKYVESSKPEESNIDSLAAKHILKHYKDYPLYTKAQLENLLDTLKRIAKTS